jgi:hypothetical protein
MVTMEGLRRWARRRWGEHAGPLLLAIGVVLVPSVGRWADPGFRQDELVCEEAVAHVAHCCGWSGVNETCTYWEDCDGEAHHPSIGPEQADCLRLQSCRSLVEHGICAAGLDPLGEGMPRCE